MSTRLYIHETTILAEGLYHEIAHHQYRQYRTETHANSYGANRRGCRTLWCSDGFIRNLIGGKQLGYNITAISKGKRAFPFHNHQVNEEMFFVLAGHGEIRIGDGAFPIKAGDSIACLDREAKRLLIRSSTPVKRNCAF